MRTIEKHLTENFFAVYLIRFGERVRSAFRITCVRNVHYATLTVQENTPTAYAIACPTWQHVKMQHEKEL